MVKCPYCDKPLPPVAELCPHAGCEMTLPVGYGDACRGRPMLDVVIAGYSGHGKSEFLLSLVLTLNGIDQRLPGAMVSYGHQTEEVLRRYVYHDETGRAAGATQKKGGDRLVFGLQFVPPLADRFVRIKDTAGEIYRNREEVAAEVPELKSAAAVWLVHSPFDQLNGRPTDTLVSLLQAVHASFQRSQSVPTAARKRQLVVILSKADKLLELLPSGLSFRDTADPFAGVGVTSAGGEPADLDAYLEYLKGQSAEFKQKMGAVVPTFHQFVQLAEKLHYTVSFTLVSALGRDPQVSGGKGQQPKREPARVMDPLLMTLSAAEVGDIPPAPVALVLDGSADAGPVSQPNAGAALAYALADYATVTCFRLGQTAAASAAGQPPATADDAPGRPRLIGPILETLPAGTRVVVLANGPVLDLADHQRTGWADRLVLIRTDPAGSGGLGGWPKRLAFRPGDDASVAARQILELTAPPPPPPAGVVNLSTAPIIP